MRTRGFLFAGMVWAMAGVSGAADYHITTQQDYDGIGGLDLEPGDRVLFKAGAEFTGNFVLDSADGGTAEAPVVLMTDGDTRATIHADTGEKVISLESVDHVRISGLDVVGFGRMSSACRRGLGASSSNNVTLDHLSFTGFQGTTVSVNGSDNRIEYVDVSDGGQLGILMGGGGTNADTTTWGGNFYVGHCIIRNIAGDPTRTSNHSGNGIMASYAIGGLIEYCAVTDCGWDQLGGANGPGGIWIHNVDSVVMQYCIVRNQGKGNGTYDGNGMGFDAGVQHSTIQYCYIYNTEGAGLYTFEAAMNDSWVFQLSEGNIFRYNIIKDCGNLWGGSFKASYKANVAYNNTIVQSNGVKAGGTSSGAYFNNIELANAGTGTVDGNGNYKDTYSVENAAKVLNNAGVEDTLFDPDLLHTLTAYMQVESSPCIDVGRTVADNGGMDFFGTAVPAGNGPDRGAHEFTSVSARHSAAPATARPIVAAPRTISVTPRGGRAVSPVIRKGAKSYTPMGRRAAPLP